MSEMDKLEQYLKEHDEYMYERHPLDGGTQIIVLKNGTYFFDVICTRISYGYNAGLLEVKGRRLIDRNNVIGHRTAEDIIKMMEEKSASAIRLIDANRLKNVLEKNFGHTGGAAVLSQLIDEQPTAYDAEAVVGWVNKWSMTMSRAQPPHIYMSAIGTNKAEEIIRSGGQRKWQVKESE